MEKEMIKYKKIAEELMKRFKMTRTDLKSIGNTTGMGYEIDFYSEQLGVSASDLKIALHYVRAGYKTVMQVNILGQYATNIKKGGVNNE